PGGAERLQSHRWRPAHGAGVLAMNVDASVANGLWLAGSLGRALRFARALADPRGAQEAWLRAQLARHADSAFGRLYEFSSIRNAAEFAGRVPLTEYAGVESYVNRIRHGERNVLTGEPVTHLVPTSGSTGARKLIPFSPSLQDGFSAAVSAWILDLVRQ